MIKKFLFMVVLSMILSFDSTEGSNIPLDNYATSFCYPVGSSKNSTKGYYNAQKFGVNGHLGEDWNGIGGGNSDLGDNIYAVANGYVFFAENIDLGWGNIIRIKHYRKEGNVESLYAHCDKILVKSGQYVKKGQLIGTIGTCSGRYIAHLHFEIRDEINMWVGPGYGTWTTGYLNPTKFIKQNLD